MSKSLSRYVARPAMATDRLSLLPDGRVMYELKHRWLDGNLGVGHADLPDQVLLQAQKDLEQGEADLVAVHAAEEILEELGLARHHPVERVVGVGGGVETVNYTIDSNTVTYSGTMALGDKQYKMKGIVVFAPDFMSDVEKREISLDGKTWTPIFETKFTKAKSSPK